MEIPYIIKGGKHSDKRGKVYYNNDFDISAAKRFYIIENWSTETIRGWQGHKIEKRWFSVLAGSFKIEFRAIDDWNNPSPNCKLFSFTLLSDKLDILCVPKGYVSKIQALELDAKLIVFADYLIGETKDEYRFDIDYFNE